MNEPRRWSAPIAVATEVSRYLTRVALTVALAGLVVFIAIDISIPGGFARTVLPAGVDETSPRDMALIDTFDLDGNLVSRYLRWLGDVATGDWGRSTESNTPVSGLVSPRLTISLELMVLGTLGAVGLGLPLGLLTAAWATKRSGTALRAVLGVAQSVPVYVSSLFFVWAFAVELRWLPAAGWVRISDSLTENIERAALPVLCLVVAEVGIVARIVTGDVLRVLQTDYMVAAASKGLNRRYLLFRHALRPASLGLLNVIGLNIATLLSGTVLVEFIFGLPGLGQLILGASINRDLYLLLAVTTYVVVVYVTLNTIVDIAMRRLDPRLPKPRAFWHRFIGV